MGPSGDLERLRGVIELLDERDLLPRRVRVGEIEVELVAPAPSYDPGDAHPIESDREREERERHEFEALMYAASEGPDYS